MAKAPHKDKRPERLEDVETEPGAWERFERAVDAALHTPPKQRPKRERGEKRERSKGGEPK